jgi:hypothetical protein
MTRTTRIATWIAIPLLALAAVACESKAPAGDGAAKPAATSQAASGTKHEPPIEKDAVPAGHWYCDMGTVHYSQPEKGDATCPLCKMKLKQK